MPRPISQIPGGTPLFLVTGLEVSGDECASCSGASCSGSCCCRVDSDESGVGKGGSRGGFPSLMTLLLQEQRRPDRIGGANARNLELSQTGHSLDLPRVPNMLMLGICLRGGWLVPRRMFLARMVVFLSRALSCCPIVFLFTGEGCDGAGVFVGVVMDDCS